MYLYVYTQVSQLSDKYKSFNRKYKKVLIFFLVFQASQWKLLTEFSMHH